MSYSNSIYENTNQHKINDKIKKYRAITDKNRNIILPDEIKKKLGLKEGSEIKIMVSEGRIEVLPNIHSLAKVYIEPTSLCNLACQTCVRNTWNESLGDMKIKTFNKIIEQLKEFTDVQSVMFGGFGEPTFHKDIIYMINRIKSLNLIAEMTTNGTLLDENMIKGLFKNKLDTLWVSFDGADKNTFESIRKGSNYNNLIESLKLVKSLNKKSEHKIKVGIASVLMKKNIDSLNGLVRLAVSVGASKLLISNVLPYSKDMFGQTLYNCSVDKLFTPPNQLSISLPLIDVNDNTKEQLYSLFKNNNYNISINNNSIDPVTRKCKFIEERNTFIRWDGMVSPCMGLLHESKMYPYTADCFEREVKAYTVGDINARKLKEIWDSEEYRNFREKVEEFDFSPCLHCGPCEYAESNSEDCFGNNFPTCGGCLWAHPVIQCP